MADPIPIRPAEPRDLPAITRIYDHAVRHGTASFEIEPPDEREMARRYEALRAGGYPYLVAELDAEIAGYAYAGPYRARAAYRWSVGFKFGRWLDSVLMQRPLGTDATAMP